MDKTQREWTREKRNIDKGHKRCNKSRGEMEGKRKNRELVFKTPLFYNTCGWHCSRYS
jgi:hypothetical protein